MLQHQQCMHSEISCWFVMPFGFADFYLTGEHFTVCGGGQLFETDCSNHPNEPNHTKAVTLRKNFQCSKGYLTEMQRSKLSSTRLYTLRITLVQSASSLYTRWRMQSKTHARLTLNRTALATFGRDRWSSQQWRTNTSDRTPYTVHADCSTIGFPADHETDRLLINVKIDKAIRRRARLTTNFGICGTWHMRYMLSCKLLCCSVIEARFVFQETH